MACYFADVLARCTLGITGYVSGPGDLVALERMIEHNLAVLRRCSEMIVATNFAERDCGSLQSAHTRLWHRYFPQAIMLDSPTNRGHSIGSCDLDNMLFDYCQAHRRGWLCKSANDVALGPIVCEIPVEPADFYYLNAVSDGALAREQYEMQRVAETLFFPQTTFFAVNVATTDYLVDTDLLNRSWRIVNRIPDYNGRIWEYIPGWSCERLLQLCVERNQLSRYHLMSYAQWLELLEFVKDQHIDDCSHKGISINGICHAQGLRDLTSAHTITGTLVASDDAQ